MHINISKKVLIISVSGIGNTILHSPMINAILDDPKYEVDVLFGKAEMAGVYKYNCKIKEQIILFNFFSLFKIFRLVLKLFFKRYDYSISCFPSRRIFFNLLPFLCGIKNRCIHTYQSSFFSLQFLSNRKILANPKIHDVEQNLNLLTFLNIQKPQNPKTYFGLSEDDKIYAQQFLTQHHLDYSKIIGIHPGSGGLVFKRWEPYKYKALISLLVMGGFQIIVFGTGSEISEYAGLNNVYLFEGDINQTGALISYCRFFISGDTGLMHIAATFGVEQVVIWKGTSFSRTSPLNTNAKIIFAGTKSKYLYPFF